MEISILASPYLFNIQRDFEAFCIKF